ncbi:MAG: 16S rRNA (guanine(527)-N(7))-methyltransferase RsmG [Kangiellaceae bacterium]|jgi:16S rRNA (guanine527-N7)-methyltransferase
MQDLSLQLKRSLDSLNISVKEQQQIKLLKLLQQLLKWNKAYNLTAITDENEALKLHILDSLAVAPLIEQDELIDVGTGPGFPGLPLAILLPNKRFTLLDSNSKKIRFILQIKHELGLDNVEAVHARVEDFSSKQFPAVISRAFASIEDMVELTRHLLAPGGCWLAMKAQYQNEEVDYPRLAVKEVANHAIEVPGLNAQRCLIEIRPS